MAVFPEAKERRLKKKICRKCGGTNSINADKCRRCGSRALRPKKTERKV